MTEYIVYREGWNEANQDPGRGLPEKMPVVRLYADSPEEACRMAARQVTLTGNQRLTAEPAEVVDAQMAGLNASPRLNPDEGPG
jgi:hypothetical protein